MTQLSHSISLLATGPGPTSVRKPAAVSDQKPGLNSAFSPGQQAVAHHKIPRGHPPENSTGDAFDSALIAAQSTRGQWETFARHHSGGERPDPSVRAQAALNHAVQRQEIYRRQSCHSHAATEKDGKTGYLPLSRTTDRVLRILLDGDLSRVRAESVAETLGISCTTLRRRLRNDHTSYQFLLDRSRQYRCESRLRERWLPGKCLADELGYLEVNSFYRAFRRWTGLSYSDYRQMYH
ncbi:MAG: AraC family mar-sox-rob regulon transcriptional activator [Glaciecola sp.]|jgi:AraC family mar-sox-rob regulon transcriptional activator|uniref:helix-turn-helix domain-containing protein n=1 Tax=Congregibacter sp. TaxID=2744308 RepID=UPI0039E22D97